MCEIVKTRFVPYSPELMFKVVLDIDRYFEFIPHCKKSKVTKISENETCEAFLDMNVGFLNERVTCRVDFDSDKLIINSFQLKGPFKYLSNSWTFVAVEGGCEVRFKLVYKMSNKFIAGFAKKIVEQVYGKYVVLFEERAAFVAKYLND